MTGDLRRLVRQSRRSPAYVLSRQVIGLRAKERGEGAGEDGEFFLPNDEAEQRKDKNGSDRLEKHPGRVRCHPS
jgi:hypothetical protein